MTTVEVALIVFGVCALISIGWAIYLEWEEKHNNGGEKDENT